MTESMLSVPLQLEQTLRYLSPTRIAQHFISNYKVEGRLSSLSMGLLSGDNPSITLGARIPKEAVLRQNYSDITGAMHPDQVEMFYLYSGENLDFGFLQVEKGHIRVSLTQKTTTKDAQMFFADVGGNTYYEAATLHVGRILRGENGWPRRTVPFTSRVVVEKAGIGAEVTILKKDVIYINEQPSFCRWKYAGDASRYVPPNVFVQPDTTVIGAQATLGDYKLIRHSITKVLPAGPDRRDAA